MILDTNAVSALADGQPEFERAAANVDNLFLPVIVLGEFYFGVRRSRYRHRYETWLRRLLEVSTLLVIDGQTASHYADIREDLRRTGEPIPSNDTWIAALALQHQLAVLSRDRHFDAVPGLRRVSW